jgi:hypothetical protein
MAMSQKELEALMLGVLLVATSGVGHAQRAGQVGGGGVPSEESAPLLRVRFGYSCDLGNVPPNFSLEVYADGAVRYSGSEEVHERGTHPLRIDAGAATRLHSYAERVASRSEFDRHHPRGYPVVESFDGGMIYGERCALLDVQGVDGTRSVLLGSRIGEQFESRLDRVLHYAELICPDRGRAVQVSRLCESRLLSFYTQRQAGDCAFEQVLNVYETGRAHSYVIRDADSDRFFDIGEADLDPFVRFAASLPGDEVGITALFRGPQGKPRGKPLRTITFTPETTQLLVTRAEALLGTAWAKSQKSAACVPGRVTTGGSVTLQGWALRVRDTLTK